MNGTIMHEVLEVVLTDMLVGRGTGSEIEKLSDEDLTNHLDAMGVSTVNEAIQEVRELEESILEGKGEIEGDDQALIALVKFEKRRAEIEEEE